MEKRRRERINHSLESLRLLMVDTTDNEKLKNPKVEKAEILESVVEFLKTEKETPKSQQAMKRALSREPRPTCSHEQNYQNGMRSCLLRVSQFIASKSQKSEDTGGNTVQASFTHPEPQAHVASPGPLHGSLMASPAGNSAALPHHHGRLTRPYLTPRTGLHCNTSKLLSSTAGSAHNPDPVWRPWP
ncbi:hairy-related 5 [Embiotoca jacksoni]|uniref:hairy-related 5 n=1 Tax=Embiotoca jacksoni TaxID=100190 RepID=UPI003704AF79